MKYKSLFSGKNMYLIMSSAESFTQYATGNDQSLSKLDSYQLYTE